MKDVNDKEILVGDKLFTIQGWTGIVRENEGKLSAVFKKWCGAIVRTIDITEETIKSYDMKKVK